MYTNHVQSQKFFGCMFREAGGAHGVVGDDLAADGDDGLCARAARLLGDDLAQQAQALVDRLERRQRERARRLRGRTTQDGAVSVQKVAR